MGTTRARFGRAFTAFTVSAGLVLTGVAGAAPAAAATVDVCPSGCTYSSINAAVAAASAGDTVTVAAGTYALSATIVIDKALTLVGPQSGVHPTSGGRAGGEATISGTYPISIESSNVTVSGFEIADFRHAVYVPASAFTAAGGTLHDIVVSDNWEHSTFDATEKTGFTAEPGTLDKLTISGNLYSLGGADTATNPGGAFLAEIGFSSGTAAPVYSNVTVSNNEFAEDVLSGGGYALFAGADPAAYVINTMSISGNYFHLTSNSVNFNIGNISNGTFAGNVVTGTGGTVGIASGSITGNTFTAGGRLGLWGSVYGFTRPSGALTIANNRFEDNVNGRGIVVDAYADSQAARDAGVYTEPTFPVTVYASTINLAHNSFVSSATGNRIRNFGLNQLASTSDWWGSNAGPGTGVVSGCIATPSTSCLVLGDVSVATWLQTHDENPAKTVAPTAWPISASGLTSLPGFWPRVPQVVTPSAPTTGKAGESASVSGTSTASGAVTVAVKVGNTNCEMSAPGTVHYLAIGDCVLVFANAGDATHMEGSQEATITVSPGDTTTTLVSGTNPSVYGGSVTFTATVTTGATGTVTFKDGLTTLGTGTISGTTATYTTSALTGGSHSITAVYEGDTNFATSTSSPVSQSVSTASSTTTLLSGTNPSVYGGSVTFTATVTTGATGTVTFKDGSTTLGTGTISGTTATYSTSALTGGSHSITAVYEGDSNYATSTSSPVSQSVTAASSTTSVASGTNPSVYGGSVTFTATVTSGATGTVTFKDGLTTLGTGTISGTTATYTTSALTGGSHSITAVYEGDTNYATSTSSPVSQSVGTASSTTTLVSGTNPSVFGGSVTFTATVTSGATGTVTFKDGLTTLGTGSISGTTATYTTSALTGGSHSITAVYEGDTNYATSTSSPVSQSVGTASSTTTLVSGTNPSVFGGSVTFTATVTTGATGTVTFKDGLTTLGTGTISGTTATYTTSALTGGSHSITAVYEGDANYATSTSSPVSQSVSTASSTTTLVSGTNPSVYGGSVTFTATVTSGATGTVTFKDGLTTLGTGTISGTTATYTTSALTGGSHSITAVYEGDSNYATSTSSPVSQSVSTASSTTTLVSGTNPSAYGGSVTFTATVTTGATGTVTFKDGLTTLGTGTISSGTATYATSGLSVATHSITAVYEGDSNYATSTSSPVSQVVGTASTTTTLVSGTNPSVFGGSVTFTATVTSGATGTVTFKDGLTTLGTGTISGTTATYTTSALTGGSHSITAVYAGDANYATSTSSPVSQSVTAASSTTSVASGTNPSVYGGPVTFTATVTSGATGTVTFKDGSTTLGTGTLSGTTATYTTSALTGGSHSITAVYEGDTNYATSTSSPVSQSVSTASTTTTVSPSTATPTLGDSVVLTATVTTGATGTVEFFDGATSLGTGTLSGDSTTLSTSALAVGAHSITAVYGGDTNWATSTSAATTVTVQKLPQTVVFTSAIPTGLTVTDTYAPTATGTVGGGAVSFSVATPSICTIAAGTVTMTGPGICVVTADQAATATYSAAASVTQSVVVAPLDTSLAFESAVLTPGTTTATITNADLGSPSLNFGAGSETVSVAVVEVPVADQPDPAAGTTPFKVSGGTTFIDIQVTGAVGPYHICIDGTAGQRLWHYEDVSGTMTWVDVTDATQVTPGKICGTTNSLSPFAAAAGKDAQAALTITPASGTVGQPVTLRVTGGTLGGSVGAGTLVFETATSGCAINGALLSRTTAGDCVVTASMAGNATYNPVDSAPVTITFTASTCTPRSLLLVNFSGKSAVLNALQMRRLRAAAVSIVASGCSSVLLKGYAATSHQASKASNAAAMRIAKARNLAVQRYLSAKLRALGSSVTITTKAVGAQSFLESNVSRAGQAANRRVAVLLRS